MNNRESSSRHDLEKIEPFLFQLMLYISARVEYNVIDQRG